MGWASTAKLVIMHEQSQHWALHQALHQAAESKSKLSIRHTTTHDKLACYVEVKLKC